MAFLPFYVPAVTPDLVIVGGGYAGMAALAGFRRYCPKARITLIDPGEHHLKITRLHEVFRTERASVRVPYAHLARRFDFRHLRAALPVDDDHLRKWGRESHVDVDGEQLPFDYLLIAVGVPYAAEAATDRLFSLYDVAGEEISRLVERLQMIEHEQAVNVIGAGPTGLQFLFELAEFFRSRGRHPALRLIDADDRLLSRFSVAMGAYVEDRLAELNVEVRMNTLFRAVEDDTLLVENRSTGQQKRLDAGLSFNFAGKRARRLESNAYGQIVLDGAPLPRLFSAGDCTVYRGPGCNAMTAQAAVRKGSLCARNILRHAGGWKILEPYLHRELGYVISLGRRDAVGWVGARCNVVAGSPAVVLKDLMETRHDLTLAGVNTYLP
ncbi:NAD(P)/FAD-dependent oxidoreductase [Methylococcus sp. EFPC2]|uniref:NAD(P)/FAD-dependent oxidoreductase n=1 Tax=Methylococcus sp. EFPC2 TaxID=2812648 RepID=UPI0019671007|nr:FAD-dependent oxidoreductase [Methylococcus sp. EFPC2]QSA95604.1 FAD-dependent oxidoreductase [Methylococcus sp. EFPC2]